MCRFESFPGLASLLFVSQDHSGVSGRVSTSKTGMHTTVYGSNLMHMYVMLASDVRFNVSMCIHAHGMSQKERRCDPLDGLLRVFESDVVLLRFDYGVVQHHAMA